jgi:N-acetylglucosaminyl-diphospho-decaprenol L-rhamnosyltransferase
MSRLVRRGVGAATIAVPPRPSSRKGISDRDADKSITSLGVVVVHWRSPRSVVRTVAGLLASRSVSVTVLVVDNASPPDDIDLLRQELTGKAEIVHLPHNIGFVGAANVGLARLGTARSQFRYLAVSAHDTVVGADTLGTLVTALDSQPMLGIVGPVFGDEPRAYVLAHSYPLEAYARSQRELGSGIYLTDWITGALMVLRPECLQQVGQFDDRLFAYCEDVDLCLRAWRSGWRVAVIEGAHASESGAVIGTSGRVYLIARNNLLLVRWHQSAVRFITAVVRVVMDSVRAGAASLILSRHRDRRSLSRTFARSQFLGAIDALRGRSGPPPSRFQR